MVGPLLKSAAVASLAALAGFYYKHQRHAATGLAPLSGNLAKVALAYLMVTPQNLKAPALEEGWHDDPAGDSRLSSEHWSENLYFWANTRPGTPGEFLYTVRLSFTGPGATKPVSWWSFHLDGEDWSLPTEFDAQSPVRKSPGGEREVVVPSLGRLEFHLDKPLEQWTLSYDGIVESSTGKRMHCNSKFVVRLNPRNVYSFTTMQDPLSIAKSMSRRPWNAAYFKSLRSQMQTRYTSLATEVTGTLALATQAGGVPVFSLPSGWVGDGSRDHNWGVRKWNYIWRYIWFPPVRFAEPLEVDGSKLTYFTGTFVEYGSLENAVVGGILDEDGGYMTWSGATPMGDIAPKWFKSPADKAAPSWGAATVPAQMNFSISFGDAVYILDISVERGRKFGLWDHTFKVGYTYKADIFEIHEAMTRWSFTVRTAADGKVLQRTTAIGLLEFGANLENDFASADLGAD